MCGVREGDLGNIEDISLPEPVCVGYMLVACLSGRGCVSLCLPSMSQTPGCSSSGGDNRGLGCGCASECGFVNMATWPCEGGFGCVSRHNWVCTTVCVACCVSACLDLAEGERVYVTRVCLSESACGSGM